MYNGKTAVVTGAASGLGEIIAKLLRDEGFAVRPFDKVYGDDVRNPVSLEELARCDVLVNAAGVNGINWLDDVTYEEWDEILGVNVSGMFRVTQRVAPLLRESRGVVLNIVSDASTKPMRCSAAYNASKGAAAILTKQLARELAPDGVTVFGVSPNKLAGTGMSQKIDGEVCRTRGWTTEQARDYQLAGLLNGEETDPYRCAEFCAWLLADRERARPFAGCDIPYGA